MDSWYATNKLMLYIEDLDKYYYCPLKRNRLVDDTGNKKDYQKIELLSWDKEELKSGKIVKIKKFPGAKKVKLFRVTVSTGRTDFIATNDYLKTRRTLYKKCVRCVGRLRSWEHPGFVKIPLRNDNR